MNRPYLSVCPETLYTPEGQTQHPRVCALKACTAKRAHDFVVETGRRPCLRSLEAWHGHGWRSIRFRWIRNPPGATSMMPRPKQSRRVCGSTGILQTLDHDTVACVRTMSSLHFGAREGGHSDPTRQAGTAWQFEDAEKSVGVLCESSTRCATRAITGPLGQMVRRHVSAPQLDAERDPTPAGCTSREVLMIHEFSSIGMAASRGVA